MLRKEEGERRKVGRRYILVRNSEDSGNLQVPKLRQSLECVLVDDLELVVVQLTAGEKQNTLQTGSKVIWK